MICPQRQLQRITINDVPSCFSFVFGQITYSTCIYHVWFHTPPTIPKCRVPYSEDVTLHFLTPHTSCSFGKFPEFCEVEKFAYKKNTSWSSDSITQNRVFCLANTTNGVCLVKSYLYWYQFHLLQGFFNEKEDKFIFKINRFKIENWWLWLNGSRCYMQQVGTFKEPWS